MTLRNWLRKLPAFTRSSVAATPKRRAGRTRLLVEHLEDRVVPANYSGTLSGSQTWDSSDVRIITGNLTIPSGVNLTIQSGTVVKFNFANLYVDGTLNAQG